MPNRNEKDPIPYVILGSDHDQNVRFYERYDANFLYNKVVSLLYLIDQGDEAVQQVEAFILTNGGGKLSSNYLESLRAEIFFTTLHQCETFFAMLVALFQPLPHWVYLTTYETWQVKEAVDRIVDGKIGELTDGQILTIQDFVKVAVYAEVTSSEPEHADRWEENIDNAAWIIQYIGEFFQEYDRAYNSYKHGLRVMTGPHSLGIALRKPDGTPQGPMHIIQSSEDALTYLQKEPVREVEGMNERPISEVTKVFSPSEAYFYLFKMQQMLETMRATRLARLRGDSEVTSINTYFGLDRDEVRQLMQRGVWTAGPMRADEARVYEQNVAHMQVNSTSAHEPDAPNDPPAE